MVSIRVRVFNATFNPISVISGRSVLLKDQTGRPTENNRPVTSHWQTLSHNIVSSTPRHEQDSNLQLQWWYAHYCTGSGKFNYHTIPTTMAPAYILRNTIIFLLDVSNWMITWNMCCWLVATNDNNYWCGVYFILGWGGGLLPFFFFFFFSFFFLLFLFFVFDCFLLCFCFCLSFVGFFYYLLFCYL